MSDLAERLLAHARARNLFPEPGLALLAVSGGPDSVALLDLMVRTQSDLGITLAVAHVDHGIAADSAAVGQRVRAMAGAHGLAVELSTLALGQGASETDARTARYAALRETQQRLSARYLVTAHQADDQIETILFRLLKGSGTAGLAGIPAAGPDGLVRPLLPFRRDELKAWLGDRYDVHTDPANFDPRHDRSWLRHHVLPALKGRVPGVERNLLERGRVAGEDRRAWSAALHALPDLDVRIARGMGECLKAPLAAYDRVLSETLIRALAREAGCRIGPGRAARVARFLSQSASGRTLQLGEGWVAELAFDRLRIRRESAAAPAAVPWGDHAEGEARFGDWTFRWSKDRAGTPSRSGLVTWVTPGAGALRCCVAGDRLRPLGGAGRRAVSRLLMEARVPVGDRNAYPLVVRGEDVLWIPGVCRGAAQVPEPGQTALRLEASAGA